MMKHLWKKIQCSGMLAGALTAVCLPAQACAEDSAAAAFPEVYFGGLRECEARGGMPNFFRKLRSGGEVRIAYFGGSITAQAGWRVQSREYFQQKYPQAQVVEINAALGGTGTGLGVFRLAEYVLKKKPDLMFLSFATNDATSAPDEVLNSVEGIVRQTWKASPECDICQVYPITLPLLKEVQSGKLWRSAEITEKVMAYYGIPSINTGLPVAHLEKNGKLLMKAPEAKVMQLAGKELDIDAPAQVGPDGKIPFSQDGLHPYNNTGHRIYTQLIVRSLPALMASGQPGLHALPAPLSTDNLEQTSLVALDGLKKQGPWHKLADNDVTGNMEESFADKVPSLWKAEPGATLRLRVRGRQVAFYDLLGPDCGKLEISIDGQVSNVNRVDAYTVGYRLGSFSAGEKLNSLKVHEITIKVLPEMLDKSKIIMESRQGGLKKTPERYQGSNWYVGAVMLVGSLEE